MTGWRRRRLDEAQGLLDDDERDMVVRCLRGDEAAWTDLYVRHSPEVARFLARLLGGREGVDDLVQEVFLRVMSCLGRFRGEARLSTWILGVATNVAMHYRRSEARKRARLVSWDVPAERSCTEDSPATQDGESGAVARAGLRVVMEALENVPVDQRAAWILAEVDGKDTAEVAAALGIPEGTVRSRLFHVRRRLLEALGEAGYPRQDARDGLGVGEARLAWARTGRDG